MPARPPGEWRVSGGAFGRAGPSTWTIGLFFIFLGLFLIIIRASLIAQLVKNLPAMQETLVRFLGQEDPLEKDMATHSSILAWRIPWTEESCRLQSIGSQESDMT